MKHTDMEAFAKFLAPVVRDYFDKVSTPLIERIAMLEGRELPAPLQGEKGEPGERGEKGDPGADADEEEIVARLLVEIERAVEALPPPGRGEKGDKGDPGEKGDKGEPGQDGAGVADALIDRSGNLVLTLEDGRIRDLGPVVGRDGEAGPEGKGGRDGFGFDDLSVSYDGRRGLSLLFERNGERKTFDFKMPIVLDAGVYREGQAYHAGDGVSCRGSFWIAQRDTEAKPGESEDWRLAVKRGRDGRIPDMDAFLERALPRLTERLAPVVRKAAKEANDGR